MDFDAHPDGGTATGGDVASDTGPSSCIQQISIGAQHTCVLLATGVVQCWGDNTHGELGNGPLGGAAETPFTVLAGGVPLDQVTEISAGVESTTCARRSDGTVWCWGENASGQLGNGVSGSATTDFSADSGTPGFVIGSDGLPFGQVASVIVGEQSACAVRDDASLWCWGDNVEGELGSNAGTQSLVPVNVYEQPSNSPLAPVTGGMVSFQHACAWTSPQGQLYCWGSDSAGQLGDGDTLEQRYATLITQANVLAASSANIHTCALIGDGTMRCWGNNNYGQLGVGNETDATAPVVVKNAAGTGPMLQLSEIGVGDYATCARASDGSVFCWGNNDEGQTGNGQLGSGSSLPQQVVLPAPATRLAVGNVSACAVLADDSIECWGENQGFQLGSTAVTATATPLRAQFACP